MARRRRFVPLRVFGPDAPDEPVALALALLADEAEPRRAERRNSGDLQVCGGALPGYPSLSEAPEDSCAWRTVAAVWR